MRGARQRGANGSSNQCVSSLFSPLPKADGRQISSLCFLLQTGKRGAKRRSDKEGRWKESGSRKERDPNADYGTVFANE